jgi:N-acylglucosamine-6-phosphate 2-epimerase
LERIKRGIVISSQAMDPKSPLKDPVLLAILAQTAGLGGAHGYRVDGADVVRELRGRTELPIIAIRKNRTPGIDTFITPTSADAVELIEAGAEIVAAEATKSSRGADSFRNIVDAAHAAGGLVMADISTLEEAIEAEADGADLVGTTLVGYTPASENAARPALDLVEQAVARLGIPVILEGGVWTPEHIRAAFELGAHAIVVGAAVTAPDFITRRLVEAIPR